MTTDQLEGRWALILGASSGFGAAAARALAEAGMNIFGVHLDPGSRRARADDVIAEDPDDAVDESGMEMTLKVMAHTLVYWVQDLVHRNLLGDGSRVYALSSGGAERMAPNYGAVSAAKAALESHMRQLTLELGPHAISVNCLRPGVTDTPALRAIPGHETYIEEALKRNPRGRLTTPEHVAKTLVALADPDITWISGAVIPVDAGESIVG